MAQVRDHDAAIRRFSLAAALVLGVGVVVISYVGVRYDRRWTKVVDTLAGPKERLERLKAGYAVQRENVADIGELAGIAVDEYAKARAGRSTMR